MNILITGGNGFIGSHLTECLLRKGHNVTIFDRNLPSRDDVDFRLGDIKDSEAVMDAVNHCDRWVNLAGLLGTQEMLHKPHEAVAVNIDGALNVFQAAALHKKPGFR
jgi:nucleoside-diphosphate-sugar epimerase